MPNSDLLPLTKKGETGRNGRGSLYVKAAGNEYIDLIPGENLS